MALADNALITLSYVENIDMDDADKEELINAASAYFITAVDKDIIATTYTEYGDVENNTRILRLQHRPVNSLAIVFDDETLTTANYLLDDETGLVYALDGQSWYTENYDSIVITYNAGWSLTDMPNDIKQAVKQIFLMLYMQQQSSTLLASMNMEDTFVEHVIKKYRRWA
jgi:hypothetical protein